ncbi:MAG: hypothetical protein AB8H79_26500 [Myxococcota bacterium]
MARVEVHGGAVTDGRIATLNVRLVNLGERSLDRDQALSWMKDGHTFIPVVNGEDHPALQLVEIVEGDDVQHMIRADHQAVAQDSLPFE